MRRLSGRYSEVSPRSVVWLPHVVRPPRVAGLPGLAGLACAALVVSACTPGPASSGHSAGPSASASAQPSGQASAPGKGGGASTAPAPPPLRWGNAFQVPGLNGLNAGLQEIGRAHV